MCEHPPFLIVAIPQCGHCLHLSPGRPLFNAPSTPLSLIILITLTKGFAKPFSTDGLSMIQDSSQTKHIAVGLFPSS